MVTSVPASFTAAGDFSIAYDLNFTNPTSSFIKSAAPLTIQSGEVFNSSDLTLKTFNTGKLIIDSANLFADGTYVGIGTTAPTYALDLFHDYTKISGGLIQRWQTNLDTAHLRLTYEDTPNTFIFSLTGASSRLSFTADSNVLIGIGSTAPDNRLDVNGAMALGSYGASLTNSTAPNNGLIVSGTVGIGTSLPASGFTLDVNGRIQMNISNTVNTQIGVCKNVADSGGIESNVELGDCSGTPSDIAEYYPGEEGLLPGDVVSLADVNGKHKVVKSGKAYDPKILGIVSTDPVGQFGKPLGYSTIPEEDNPVAIGLAGKIPILVSLENGPIAIGDGLAASSKAGIAMKATQFARVVGYALESFDGSVIVSEGVRFQERDRSTQIMKYNDEPVDPTEPGVGKILTYFNLSYYYPELALNQNGAVSSENISGVPPDTVTNSSSSSAEISSLTEQINELSDKVASISANLADLTSQGLSFGPAPDTASISATLANLNDRVNFLEQINIVDQTSSSSASIASTSATLDQLTVYGTSSLFDVSILNKFTAGLLTIDGIASDGASLSTLGVPLKLQNNLSAPIEFMGAKVSIDTQGNLNVQEIVRAKKFEVDTSDIAAASAGKAEIPAHTTELDVETTALTEESLIFVTPEGEPVPLSAEKTGVNTFTIRLEHGLPAKLRINWWIIN